MHYIYYPEFIVGGFFLKEIFLELKFIFTSSIIYGKIIDIDSKLKKGKDSFFPVIEVTDGDNNIYQYSPAVGCPHKLLIGNKIKMRKLNHDKKILIKHSDFFNLFFKSINVLTWGIIILLAIWVAQHIFLYYGYTI